MLSLRHVHAVGGALYCGLVCMLARAVNNLYLMFPLHVLYYKVYYMNSYWGCVKVFHY